MTTWIERRIVDALRNGPATVHGLAGALFASRASVEAVLRRMESAGLVVREEAPDGMVRWRLAPSIVIARVQP